MAALSEVGQRTDSPVDKALTFLTLEETWGNPLCSRSGKRSSGSADSWMLGPGRSRRFPDTSPSLPVEPKVADEPGAARTLVLAVPPSPSE